MPTQPVDSNGLPIESVSVQGSKYQDLGQVVSGTNMAAGATVYSPVYTGLQWVRGIITLSQSDQQYDMLVSRQDTSGISDNGYGLTVNNAASTSSWRMVNYTGGNAMLGYSAKFAMKNSSASANTYANLRVQLLGQ